MISAWFGALTRPVISLTWTAVAVDGHAGDGVEQGGDVLGHAAPADGAEAATGTGHADVLQGAGSAAGTGGPDPAAPSAAVPGPSRRPGPAPPDRPAAPRAVPAGGT